MNQHHRHHYHPREQQPQQQQRRPSPPYNNQQQPQYPHYIQPPDHGSSFIPDRKGAGDEAFAPKSLDHFKRGYQERADTRPKEFYSQRHNLDGHRSNNNKHAATAAAAAASAHAASSRDPSSSWAANRDRVTVVSGLEITPLLEQLERCGENNNNGCNSRETSSLEQALDEARSKYPEGFASGKAVTALISGSARRKNTRLAHAIWNWCKQRQQFIHMNTYHYNSMIAVAATDRNPQDALNLMQEMTIRKIDKNEVTFSAAITACEKSGNWRMAIELLDSMEKEGLTRTAISYNAAISACEKGMVPQKACEVFQRMKREGIRPSVVTYSALISAAEKGSQWKLALEILEDMKADGFQANVIAYSAAISALAKGQRWEKALELFREIQACGKQPSIVTYNATMTALEKGLQWERALELFDEMKRTNLPITVVSYGSALSACDKGLQYRQCLEFLDEMTEMNIPKNVIIFGAAMSCMEKCCRADICFQLMERMKLEGVQPNVHIYNSCISACSRSNLWEKGYELFREMDELGVKRDVVTFNAVLDAVASQVRLGRMLFEEGVKQGFYARVSRLAKHWFELDLHFLSLGGGEIAMGWWFEECLVPYLVNKCEKLKDVKSISIVTGYGKTRTRGRRQGDDGMRKRCRAMLSFMGIRELDQPNLGRLHIDMDSLLEAVQKNGGKIIFDLDSYIAWKERETTVNQVPDVPQKIRPRYRPEVPGSGKPPFVRIETESTSPEYRLDAQTSPPGAGACVSGTGSTQEPYPEGMRDSWSGDRDDGVGIRGNFAEQEWESSQGQDHRGSSRVSFGGREQGNSGYDSRRSSMLSTFDRQSIRISNDNDDRRGSSYRRSSTYGYNDSHGDGPYGPSGDSRGLGGDNRGRSDFDSDRRGSDFDRDGGRPSDRRGTAYRPPEGRSGHYGPPGGGGGDGSRGGGGGRRDSSFNEWRDNGFGERRNSSFREQRSSYYGPGGSGGPPVSNRSYEQQFDRKRSSIEVQEQHQQQYQQQSRGYSLEPEPQRQRLS